jgi:hypothetical protein
VTQKDYCFRRYEMDHHELTEPRRETQRSIDVSSHSILRQTHHILSCPYTVPSNHIVCIQTFPPHGESVGIETKRQALTSSSARVQTVDHAIFKRDAQLLFSLTAEDLELATLQESANKPCGASTASFLCSALMSIACSILSAQALSTLLVVVHGSARS